MMTLAGMGDAFPHPATACSCTSHETSCGSLRQPAAVDLTKSWSYDLLRSCTTFSTWGVCGNISTGCTCATS